MFEGLIDFIESSVFSLINQINQHEESGLLQARTIVSMLLDFAEQNPGMTKVLIGDALVNEDERLQQRMNQFVERVDMALRQSWKLAAVQGMVPESDAAPRAGLLMAFVIGRWHRFAKTGFQQRPSEGAAVQLALLLG
jgi:TetR/AcrR family transcriptional regulator